MAAHRYWRIHVTRVIDNAVAVAFALIEMRSAIGGADIITGGTPTASNFQVGFPPENAIDGDSTTRWGSGSTSMPQWWKYTFPDPVSVIEYALGVAIVNGNRVPEDWTLQWSDDDSVWTDADTRMDASFPADGLLHVFSLEPIGTLSGVAKFSDGAVADTVRVSDAASGRHILDQAPGALDGLYSLGMAEAGPFNLTIMRDGYRPLTHGPVEFIPA